MAKPRLASGLPVIAALLLTVAVPGCRKPSNAARGPDAERLEAFPVRASELTLKFGHPPGERRLSFRNAKLPPEE